MRKIEHVGSLPNHLQIFAKSVGGVLSNISLTEFYEMGSVDDLIKEAVNIGYEIVPTVDMKTDRGFMVGFSAEEPKRKLATMNRYMTLKIYFIEGTREQINTWTTRIKEHRRMQIEDMRERQTRRKPIRTPVTVTGL